MTDLIMPEFNTNNSSPQGVLKIMSDKDFNRKVRKENRLIFAFSPALAPGASVALLAVSLTKSQETRLDFEKALY